MQTLPPPPAGTDELLTAPARHAVPLRGRWLDALLAVVVALVALAIRWPHLWTVPRFTDETLEVLHSLAIVRDGARPLTNYDSYYGALYNYLIAAALWLLGESPLVPRLVILCVGGLTIAATFFLARELAVGESDRRVSRAAGALAALLLTTNGAHVVVSSHIAWSNCLTPLLTTLAFWSLLRVGIRISLLRTAYCLLPTGFLFGLALQTHPLVLALLPGTLVYGLWVIRPLWRTPWPYLAVAAFALGYGNVLAYNVETGFESLRSAERIRAEYALDQSASGGSLGYLPTLGTMLLLLARVLGGAIDQRNGAVDYLADPVVMLACALASVALLWLARRGQPLPLLVTLSFLLLLPAVNPKYRTLLTSRYLMPIVPLLFTATACFLVHGMQTLVSGRVGAATLGRQRGAVTLGALIAAVLLVAAPLAPLGRYYGRTFERSDTNERILRLSAEIAASRRPDEMVLIDESIGTELPDTGLTELRGFEYLLSFARVPSRAIRTTPGRLQDEARRVPSALAVLNTRDAAAAAERVSITPLDARPPPETGRMFDYRLYRITSRLLSAVSIQLLLADR